MIEDYSCCAEKKCTFQARKKIWELNNNLHCSICGTCLTIDEQRNLLKKLYMDEKKFLDYEIHALFANNMYTENKLSGMVNSYLDKKYRAEIARYACLSEQELFPVWQEKLIAGDIYGLYWVLLTHRNLSEETFNLVVGEVHMMSHLNGGICRHERMRLQQLAEDKKKLKLRLRQSKVREKEWVAELKAARICIGKLEKQVQELQAQDITAKESKDYQTMLASLKADNEKLNIKLEETIGKCRDYKEQARELGHDNAELQRQVLQQQEMIVQLCREIKMLTGCRCYDANLPSDSGVEEDPKKGRLLMVGGNYGLNPLYRDLAENMGWEYRHHNGNLSSGRKNLMEMLKWSDFILCSLDINSHGAVHCVKDVAGKLNKEYRLLGNSSLSGVAQALADQSSMWTA
jgi:hypothetical protein